MLFPYHPDTTRAAFAATRQSPTVVADFDALFAKSSLARSAQHSALLT